MAMVDDKSVIDVIDLPIREAADGKRVLNTEMLAHTINRWCHQWPEVVVWVEQATMRPMPRPSIQSVYSISRMFGALEGMLAVLGQCARFVEPVVWKRSHSLLKKPKGASIVMASEIYANAAPYLTRVKDHDRAEAMLIAHYGMVTAMLAPSADPV